LENNKPMIRLINLLIIITVFASFTTAKGCSDSTLTGNGEGLFASTIITGAEQTSEYLPLLRGKAVAVLTNQTGIIGTTHIVDSLLSLGINIKKVMSPEHGFRGQAAAGQHISSGVDAKTGLPVVSLYGSHRKPTKADLQDIDIVVFDIQDVGVRFYTYISTLHYLMEACAENGKMLLILDRPNPNGFYVDGPVLETKYSSFVGMDPIPIVHGLTVGEYALMLNGEGWLKDGLQCNVKVIKVKNYSHSLHYKLPVAPSPNLSTMAAIYLYPSLCLFEGTVVSVGRGTSKPFEIYGHPGFTKYDTTFVPRPIAGKAPHPKLEGKTCKGFDLTEFGNSIMPVMGKLYLFWLRDSYFELGAEDDFFNPFFTKLAGTEQLRTDIERAKTVEEIRAGWQDGLNKFKKIRKKYLLYPDFE
jgi:uncharacterized protein YbbC (DUF1343 family)